jgi:hypothetical protein
MSIQTLNISIISIVERISSLAFNGIKDETSFEYTLPANNIIFYSDVIFVTASGKEEK